MNTNPPHDILSPDDLNRLSPPEQDGYVRLTHEEVRHLADKSAAYRNAWLHLPMRTRIRLLAAGRDLRDEQVPRPTDAKHYDELPDANDEEVHSPREESTMARCLRRFKDWVNDR